MSAARDYDPLADDVDELTTFDHSSPLLADELRTPAKTFGAAHPGPRRYLADDDTIIVDATRGRHRQPRHIDFVILGIRSWAAIVVTVGLAMNALLLFAYFHDGKPPTTMALGVIAFSAAAFALMNTGMVSLLAARRPVDVDNAVLQADIARMHHELARYRALLATAGFDVRRHADE